MTYRFSYVYVISACLLLFPDAVHAQSDIAPLTQVEDSKMQALEVKKNQAFIYGESSAEVLSDAYMLAEAKLSRKVREFLEMEESLSAKEVDDIISGIKNKAYSLVYERIFEIQVVCMYVKKDDLVVAKLPVLMTTEVGEGGDPVVTVEPVEAIEKEVVAPETEMVTHETEKIAQEVLVAVEAEFDQKAVIEVVQETVVPQEDVAAESELVLPDCMSESEIEVITAISAMNSYNEINDYLKLRNARRHDVRYKLVKEYGSVKGAWWVIFDASRNVVAILDTTCTLDVLSGQLVEKNSYSSSPKLWIVIY